jgi:NAD(P)H-dependent FMN reductase
VKLLVITASTRPGRIGPAITDWFVDRAKEHAAFDVEVADLATVDLPFFDEPNHPMTGKYVHEHTKAWSETVASADAIAVVLPEYNHSFTAPLKNALDFLNKEWANKPIALISYGGVSGGMRAQQALKPVLLALRMWPINDVIMIPMVRTMIGDDGVFTPTDIVDASAKTTLDELERTAGALKQLRA